MKTFRRPMMTECVLAVLPAASDCIEPTDDDFRACGYVPADVATAHVRELEGQLTSAETRAREAEGKRAEYEITASRVIVERDSLRSKLSAAEIMLRSLSPCVSVAGSEACGECSFPANAHDCPAFEPKDKAAAEAAMDELRSKLADQERRADEMGASAIKAIKMLADTKYRYAALERAAVEWKAERGRVRETPMWIRAAERNLEDAIDALTPAADAVVPSDSAYVAASPKSLTPCVDCSTRLKDGSCPVSPEQCIKQESAPAAKPATCGECGLFNSKTYYCDAPGNATSNANMWRSKPDPACPAFTRRMPVVASIPCAVSGEEPAQ